MARIRTLTTAALGFAFHLGMLAVFIAVLILYPYVMVGQFLLPGHDATRQWIGDLLLGRSSLAALWAQWPLHQDAILHGVQVSWIGVGALLVYLIGGTVILYPVLGLFTCHGHHTKEPMTHNDRE